MLRLTQDYVLKTLSIKNVICILLKCGGISFITISANLLKIFIDRKA